MLRATSANTAGILLGIAASLSTAVLGWQLASADEVSASGTIKPSGAPSSGPVRTSAGGNCIVDLIQPYAISGKLAGTLEIDYRILIRGSCGQPSGTYREEWIALGHFAGEVDGQSAAGSFTYTAVVLPGGNVDGNIVMGQGLHAELRVEGNFRDGYLTYQGILE
jgi:hypothetical protein